MEPISANFQVLKIEPDVWDVVILAEKSILQSFVKVYDNLHYFDKSVFNNEPAVVAPDFPNQLHAMAWRDYWKKAFADPDNACKTCPTVNELLQHIEKARNEP